MTQAPARDHAGTWHVGRAAWVASVALFSAALLGTPKTSAAQDSASAPVRSSAKLFVAEQGLRWIELKPAQQAVLKPLEPDWSGIDAQRKQKWLQLATRFPKLSSTEQGRIQARMVEWAKLTPMQRGQARVNFQDAKQLPAQDRQDRWEAYQALPPEQKRELAARAAPGDATAGTGTTRRALTPTARLEKSGRDVPQVKSNIVPNPAYSASPRPVSPTIVQAGPGATTTVMTKRPTPPSHQQTGLPKIAATPEFVNRATLLPQRGPQGAATRAAAATEPTPITRP